ncbi:MAG: hypothetical protein PVF83_06525 [Anaerolineales bacterium]|jgi:hypothetical protein
MSDKDEIIIKKLNSLEGLLLLIVLQNKGVKFNEIFKSDSQKKAFNLSDGELSSREIAKEVDTSHTTITNWWNEWEEKYGIVEKNDSGKYQQTITLENLILLKGKGGEKNE